MILIFCAPSGSGKSTLVHYLLERRDDLEFSVSCTTRAPRGQEEDGVDYYFISEEEFQRRIAEEAFVEYEKVYQGTYYGTLKQEIARIEAKGHHVIFDVDVKGGLNLKKYFGDQALSIFVLVSDKEELRRRLTGRGTDTPEKIEERLAKAETEMADASLFDRIIVNDDLNKAKQETLTIVNRFLPKLPRVGNRPRLR